MSWKTNITREDSHRDASRVQNCIGFVSLFGDETIQNCGQSVMNTTPESIADEEVTTKPSSSGSPPPSSLSLESDAAPLQSGKRKGVFGIPEDKESLEKNTSDDSLSASLHQSVSSIPVKKKRKRRNAIRPNSMDAKVVRNAADLHRAKEKAAEAGSTLSKEEKALCGLHDQLRSLNSSNDGSKEEASTSIIVPGHDL